jgi:hypothetical protein
MPIREIRFSCSKWIKSNKPYFDTQKGGGVKDQFEKEEDKDSSAKSGKGTSVVLLCLI